jgi:transcription antitermination factor NusG
MPRDVIAHEFHWYALAIEPLNPVEPAKVKVGEEWRVRRRLKQAGIEHYLPVEEIRQHRAGRPRNPRIVPFLPGYIFVRVSFTVTSVEAIESVTGAISLVRGAGPKPIVLPDEAIAALRKREDRDGVIRIRRTTADRFKAGDQVRVFDPASSWYGLIGEIVALRGPERVKLLFEGLKTELPSAMLVAV